MPKINELFEKVAKDIDLQTKYVEIIQNNWESGEDATYQKLIDFAKDTGYDISIDEIIEYFKGITTSKGGELPDSELDKVAGGSILLGTGFPFPGGTIAIIGGAAFPFPGIAAFPFPGGPSPFPMSSVIIEGSNKCISL